MPRYACLLVFLLSTAHAVADDWVGFRGGRQFGASTQTSLPTEWDDQKNIAWKTDLPGQGTSCPVLLGSRVYLTCYSGYGMDPENPGDQADLVRHVVCLDRQSGSIQWVKDFPAHTPDSKYQPGLDSQHGYASSTIESDGERLYAFFGASGVYCLDLEGNQLWHKDLGHGTHGWGSGASPVVYGDLVIVNASIESESLFGLNKLTGDEVWRVDGIKSCWATPVPVDAGGRTELVLNVPNRLTAYDPETGEELWFCDGCPDGYLCPSAVANDGVVYVIGARKNTALAVRAGGQGDVTDSHVLWREDVGSNVCSAVYHDGYLYWLHDKNGQAYCLDASTGKTMFRERLRPSPNVVYASATYADGKIYSTNRENVTYVFEATPDEFKLLSVNAMQEDASRTNASLAVGDGRLFLRTDQAVYCIEQQ